MKVLVLAPAVVGSSVLGWREHQWVCCTAVPVDASAGIGARCKRCSTIAGHL